MVGLVWVYDSSVRGGLPEKDQGVLAMQHAIQIDRRGFVLGSAAVLAGACLTPAALGRARRPGDILQWQSLTDHTRAVVDITLGGNSMIVASGGSAMVIDSKFPHLGPVLRADAGAPGVDVSLINTHHHGDHTGGNSAFVGRGKTYAHPRALGRIEAQIDRYREGAKAAVRQIKESVGPDTRALKLAQQTAAGAAALKAKDFVPTATLGHGSEVAVGDLSLKVHHFGAGHTDNDLVVHLESENIIHTGDLVFAGLHPFYDPSAGVSAKGWIEALGGVLALCDSNTTVVPGHGGVGGKEIIERTRSYHTQLLDAVAAEIKKGTARQEIEAMSWPFMDGLGFESIRPRAINAVYDELSSGA